MTSSGPNLENMDLDAEENLADEILSMSTEDIKARTRLMDNEVMEAVHNYVLLNYYYFPGFHYSVSHLVRN